MASTTAAASTPPTSQSSTATISNNNNTSSNTTTPSARNETTLTHLTKRFVKLIDSSSERVINLNEAAARLSVAKRRIYDITNVLEGIGLLRKTSKNVTQWIDCPRNSPFAAPTNGIAPTPQLSTTLSTNLLTTTTPLPTLLDHTIDLKQQATAGLIQPDDELLSLKQTYQSMEEAVTNLEAKIRQQLNAEGAFVTYHDIKSYFNDQIVIAVKAPPETRLEVNESLQIWMKSENGEGIEVYLCPQYSNSNNNSNNNTTHQLQQNGFQTNTSPHLQQSQLSSNLIGQQQSYTAVSSDEGRGRSTISTTDGQYYDPTSSVSNYDQYYNNDPTLSSALSGSLSGDEDPLEPLVPFDPPQEPPYNFMLEDNYTLTSLFPQDNLGLY